MLRIKINFDRIQIPEVKNYISNKLKKLKTKLNFDKITEILSDAKIEAIIASESMNKFIKETNKTN